MNDSLMFPQKPAIRLYDPLGDLLGAGAMGIQNILALQGDGVEAGDYSDASAVFDTGSLDITAIDIPNDNGCGRG